YDGSNADSLHPPGIHRYHGVVFVNWHAVSAVSPSGPTEYVYYGPTTINYIGFGTYAAAVPGKHTFYNRVTINYTESACDGSWHRNGHEGRREFHNKVTYNRLLPGVPVPGCAP
ncbi:uncharacterized protein P884DRAFT_157489, partial [Thermothelomyces heterothallicus CBS 202.75]|uniref:uncharacterized protein n=1 Tax=Thermothelomyces heterothallicus CBS 202.75 TaxID=1149848 RepID=UPI003743AD36